MTQKTISQFNRFVAVANEFVKESKAQTKLHYAIEKVIRKSKYNLDVALSEFMEDCRVKHCLKGERKEILLNDKNEKLFDEEGSLAFSKDVREFQKTVLHDVYTFFVDEADLPEGLNDYYKEEFEGFILNTNK